MEIYETTNHNKRKLEKLKEEEKKFAKKMDKLDIQCLVGRKLMDIMVEDEKICNDDGTTGGTTKSSAGNQSLDFV